MSNVSTIYSQIVTKLGEVFPTHTRIPYAYSLPDNNSNFLKKSYGLTVGPANFVESEFCNRVSQREVTVIFTREVLRVDSDFAPIDMIVNELLEDVNTVQGLFFSYEELGIEVNILKVDIEGVSGIEEVLANNAKFLTMAASFSIQIKESL